MRSPKKRFNDLSPRSQALIRIGTVVQIGLQVAALVDIARRPASEINGGKRKWVALSFVNFFGPIAYFVTGRKAD
ncbi:PLD nuclease N-terminal domain-containing protein [Gordonia sp. ABSL49_1]|uniref:PLD nuclease N-terminal domain-containing protein n=1 Tax=Gordonia sp. ABSL49_1 TaxID=2920941 RepID=UPI001F0F3AC1|nr:PLD nuclease N-terminal domain-containing protein [Gordonia sp. ABSL49_1]MCH5641293.1 PLD nuclease N-terminal domain-containing protein [Gordonia sp. ABSL49_1]